MSNHEKIDKYIQNLKSKPDTMGKQAEIYFVDEYVLKVIKEAHGNSIQKYGTNENFLKCAQKWQKKIDQVRKDGVNTPRIVEYGLIDLGNGVRQVILEERAQGSPVFIAYRWNLPGEENKALLDEMWKCDEKGDVQNYKLARQKLIDNKNLYNLNNQQKLLSKPEDVLKKYINDVKCLCTEHRDLKLDCLCENLIYDGDKALSFIDFWELKSGKKQLIADGGVSKNEIVGKAIHFFRIYRDFDSETPIGLELMNNNDKLILRTIDVAYDSGILDGVKSGVETDDMLYRHMFYQENIEKAKKIININSRR